MRYFRRLSRLSSDFDSEDDLPLTGLGSLKEKHSEEKNKEKEQGAADEGSRKNSLVAELPAPGQQAELKLTVKVVEPPEMHKKEKKEKLDEDPEGTSCYFTWLFSPTCDPRIPAQLVARH